jgi:hypothetical protein
MKILTFTKTSQAILMIDTHNGTSRKYPSVRRASEAINANNYILMNKLKGKNKKLYKDRYLIRGVFYSNTS